MSLCTCSAAIVQWLQGRVLWTLQVKQFLNNLLPNESLDKQVWYWFLPSCTSSYQWHTSNQTIVVNEVIWHYFELIYLKFEINTHGIWRAGRFFFAFKHYKLILGYKKCLNNLNRFCCIYWCNVAVRMLRFF